MVPQTATFLSFILASNTLPQTLLFPYALFSHKKGFKPRFVLIMYWRQSTDAFTWNISSILYYYFKLKGLKELGHETDFKKINRNKGRGFRFFISSYNYVQKPKYVAVNEVRDRLCLFPYFGNNNYRVSLVEYDYPVEKVAGFVLASY